MARRVFITVAEVSADRHAAALARALLEIDPTLILEGHGGPAMAAAGVRIHRDTTTRAAMGLAAVGRAAEMGRLLRWTRTYQRQNPPALCICCDSWSLNRHFAAMGKAAGAKVLYYIAPQVWASRPGRIKRLRKLVDQLACILPFEEAYFRDRGAPATFVGHPLFDGAPIPMAPPPRDLPAGSAPVIGLLGGSRKSVAEANVPRLLEVAAALRRVWPDARLAAPTTAATDGVMRRLTAGVGGIEIRQDAFDELVAGCDLCLTVSGTAALGVAAHGVPMIVVYHGNPILWHLVGRWVVRARTYSLVNILSEADGHVVPEFIPWYGSTKDVADAAVDLLTHVDQRRRQRAGMERLIANLDRPGASRRVAEMAVGMVGGRRKAEGGRR